MRIGIQTWGSDGDIRALIALGVGLRGAGHEVTVAAYSAQNTDFAPLCAESGLGHVGPRAPLEWDERRMLTAYLRGDTRGFRISLEELMYPYVEDMWRSARALCEASDLVVGQFLCFPLRAAAELTGTPHVAVTPSHAHVPNRLWSPAGGPRLARPFLPLQWWAAQLVIDRMMGREVRALWRRAGLRPFRHVLPDVWHSRLLTLVAVSRVVCPERPEWGGTYRVCGPLRMAPRRGEALPEGLEEFLAEGEPPVYMTFGSAQRFDGELGSRLLEGVARRLGWRAILDATSERHAPGSREGDIYYAGWLPHDLAFPRCAALVSSGGCGTLQAGLRAGLPSVTVAYTGEQLFWGREMERLGVSPRPMSRRRATADRVAAVLRQALASAATRRRARRLAEQMRGEDGVARAVELIERTRN